MCKSPIESKSKTSNKLVFSNNKVLRRSIFKLKIVNIKTSPKSKRFTILNIKVCYGCKHTIHNRDGTMQLEEEGKTDQGSLMIRTYEICIKCNYSFHAQCFNEKRVSILCYVCENNIQKMMPQTEKEINDFFGGDTLIKESYPYLNGDQVKDSQTMKTKRTYKKKTKTITYHKKQFKFNLPKPSKDPDQILKQKKSIAFALLAKGISFEDDLWYGNPSCPISCNNAGELEPKLQKMDNVNVKIFKKFKEMTRRGNYPPIMIEQDKLQGFIVVADDDIPKFTLIAEYAGEVDFLRNREYDESDSIMDLLQTPHSWTSLVICPEKRGNIARFFSGINNTDENAKKIKQNVKSIRYNIEGKARVFLFSLRHIKKGETLYYDYNEGGYRYPTHHFICRNNTVKLMAFEFPQAKALIMFYK